MTRMMKMKISLMTTMSIYHNWRVSDKLLRSTGAYIEILEDGPYILYRSCAGGYCRYSDDLWQAEIYVEHLLAKVTPAE